MDRYARTESSPASQARGWWRAVVLATAVAGIVPMAATLAPVGAHAQAEAGRTMSVPVAADAPERYVVKSGDTLWDIAGLYLRDPWYWPEIWYANPSIANPHLIYPGDVLYFSYVDGRPRVTLERAGAVRLSPEVRTSPLDQAIRAVPYDVLMDFVGRPSLLEKDQVRDAPYVVGMRDRHLVGTEFNEIYGRGLGSPEPGSRFNVIALGEELRDPDDGAMLGYVGHFAGLSEVLPPTGEVVGEKSRWSRKGENLTHLRVTKIGREISQGDKLLPAKVDVGADFLITPPKDEDLLGQIVAIVDGVKVAGRFQVVAINRGSRHGLVAGNALGVFYRGETVRDRHAGSVGWRPHALSSEEVRLPDERSATVVVFQVYDRMSYGLVMESSQVIRKGDWIASPRRGHRDAKTTAFER